MSYNDKSVKKDAVEANTNNKSKIFYEEGAAGDRKWKFLSRYLTNLEDICPLIPTRTKNNLPSILH